YRLFRPPRHPTTTLFPYTTLFRSRLIPSRPREDAPGGAVDERPARRRLDRRLRRPVRLGIGGAGGEIAGHDQMPAGHAAKELVRSEEHTSELQSRVDLVCRLLLEK